MVALPGALLRAGCMRPGARSRPGCPPPPPRQPRIAPYRGWQALACWPVATPPPPRQAQAVRGLLYAVSQRRRSPPPPA
eukprot:849457-Alexandrium_andersonii.AAC.1